MIMVLSHGNQGKYLSKRFHEATDEYYEDTDSLDDDVKTWVEYSTIKNAGNSYIENWTIETQPPAWPEGDNQTEIDVRKLKDLD